MREIFSEVTGDMSAPAGLNERVREFINSPPINLRCFIVSWCGQNGGGVAVVMTQDADSAIEMAWATDEYGQFNSAKDAVVEEIDVRRECVVFTNKGYG